MDDLIAFVKARLDEDEAAANEIHRPRVCGSVDRDGAFDPDPIWCGCDYPARVLREVAFKRAILAQWEHSPAGSPVLTYALYQLAAVYSDHLDYRAEWAPVTAG